MKILRFIILLPGTILLWFAVQQYFFCPRFSYNEPKPFSGDSLYNPYANSDSNCWIKCNFHAHSNAWHGFTNGHGTSNEIHSIYDSLGYSIHLVSNYQKIDTSKKDEANYIPAYEHGYNIKKNHELVLGDKHVTWLDYLFPQTLFNKQEILNKLSANENDLVIINHPDVRNAFRRSDFKCLSNYNCMEVLSPSSYAFNDWDVALSSGKPVFIVGNDDLHNVSDTCYVGRFCTWVNTPIVDSKNIISSLKRGCSYAMKIATIPGEDFEHRKKRLKYGLPQLKNFTLEQAIIRVEINQPAKKFVFSGENGKELSVSQKNFVAYYKMKKEDRYVRVSVYFEDGTEIFLNPVYRYDKPVTNKQAFIINTAAKDFFRVLGFFILCGWALLLYYVLLRR
ncbi:MAG TPA: hypothetical protein VHD35_07980 [Chitinophagaceae bacterium]|nr:hypothetical protein [Chitinophagaceae bacterium]